MGEASNKEEIPENHESHPAVKRLLARRPPHSGPWMKLTWPPSSTKPAIHMHLNYRQFVEEGHLPDPRRSKGINSRAWVSYLALTSKGKLLHKYMFANKLLPLLPQEDVKWHFGRCAVVLNSGECFLISHFSPLRPGLALVCEKGNGIHAENRQGNESASEEQSGPLEPLACELGKSCQ